MMYRKWEKLKKKVEIISKKKKTNKHYTLHIKIGSYSKILKTVVSEINYCQTIFKVAGLKKNKHKNFTFIERKTMKNMWKFCNCENCLLASAEQC